MKTRKAGCLFSLIKLLTLTILIAGVILYFSISYIVPVAVNSTGKILGIDMDLDSFSFSIMEQSVDIEGFYINNPEGFKQNTKAINLDKARVDMDSVASNYLLKDLVVIDEIIVEGFELSVESATIMDLLQNKNNLNAILAKLESEEEKAETKTTSSTSESKELKFIIKKIVFKNGKIIGGVSGATLNMGLPDFEILDIGVKEGGVSMLEASIVIFGELVTQTLSTVAKTTGSTIVDTTKDIIDGIGAGAKSIFDGF